MEVEMEDDAGGIEIGGSSWVDGMEGETWEDSGGTWMGGSGLSI